MTDRTAEALRDGEQAARERQQAEVEMEQALVAQEQTFERGTGSPIAEQADLGADAHDDARNVITAGQGQGSAQQGQGEDASGVGIVDPGAGTDESETTTSHGAIVDPTPGRGVELQGDERTFEGDGRHPLDEQ